MDAATLPDRTRPGAVGLAVPDLYDASSFYEDVVGLELLSYDEATARLGLEDRVLVELADGSDRSPRTAAEAGLYHVAIEYPSRNALGSALERVETFYELDGATDHGVTESLYLTDPAGNGVELYATAPRSAWPREDGEVVMETRPLDLDGLRAAGQAETAAPDGTAIGHFHLEVTDLAAATQFYGGELGLVTTREIGDVARFFATGDAHHHLGVTTYQERTAPATGVGLDWIEFHVPNAAAVDAATRRVGGDREIQEREDGIAVTDPDGIEVRLTVAP
ncbi:MAG: VOC family protein [Halodesulfurarchaeum sp.]